MPAHCSFEWCIYQQDDGCMFEEIDINSLGMCERAIVISFAQEDVAKQKEILREKLNETK